MVQEHRRGNGRTRIAESVATADRRATGSGGSSQRGDVKNHGGGLMRSNLCQRAFTPIGPGRYPVYFVALVSWVVAGVVNYPFTGGEQGMKHRTPRIATSLAAVAAALTLTACGGGGGDSPDPVDLLLAPRVVRLKKIIERSDTFSIPAVHFDYSVSIGNADAIANRLSNNASCTRASCDVEAEDGGMETTVVQDLIDLSVNVDTTEISLGSRGGFDTIAIASEFDVSGLILDDTATFTPPTATAFGAWGEHGFAGVVIGNGSLTGQGRQTGLLGVQTTVPFTGHLSYALAYVMGNTTGTNPSGVGVATWEGIAEAASLRTFERRLGHGDPRHCGLVRPAPQCRHRRGRVRDQFVGLGQPAAQPTGALPSELLQMAITWRETSMARGMRKPTAFLMPRLTPVRLARNETIRLCHSHHGRVRRVEQHPG